MFCFRLPTDNDAMRRFLEVRQDLHEQVGTTTAGGSLGKLSASSLWTEMGYRIRQATAKSLRRFLPKCRYHSAFIYKLIGLSTSTARTCATCR